ncbi:MAG: hypothetical protein IKJ74_05785 [Clostridia bacterium]|nr:hypothetical protein [Clostridia bacterium]
MNSKRMRRRLALLLSLSLALSLFSCGETAAPTVEGDGFSTFVDGAENTAETDPPIDTEALAEREEKIDEAEMIDVVRSWVGFSDRGVLDTPDSFQAVPIKTKSDLDPYRSFLTELTEEEETAFLADKNGYCVLLEITAKSDRHYCDISSIYNTGNTIEICVSEFEEEDPLADPQPLHSFYLFYFPGEVYHNETVKTLFSIF